MADLKIKTMLPYLAVTLAGYLLVPLLQMGYGIFYVPILVFVCAFIYGFRHRFHWNYFVYVVITAMLFVPIVFIYYNETAFYIPLVWGVIAVAGIFTGRLFAIPAP